MGLSRIGVISGMAEELAPFLADVPRDRDRIGGVDVHTAIRDGRRFYMACGGIGKVAAGGIAAMLHTRFDVDMLCVIGTAGNIGGASPGAFLITEAIQADFGALRQTGLTRYTAGTLPIGPVRFEPFRAFPLPDGHGLPLARIATGDVFVEAADHAQTLFRETGAALVDMETAAVAQAAQMCGVPWLAVKAVTDDADESSGTSFAENLAHAARVSASAMERVLRLI